MTDNSFSRSDTALQSVLEDLGRVFDGGTHHDVQLSDQNSAMFDGSVRVNPHRPFLDTDTETATEREIFRSLVNTLSHEIEHTRESVLTGKRDFSEAYPATPRLAGDVINILEDAYIDEQRLQRFPGLRVDVAWVRDRLIQNDDMYPDISTLPKAAACSRGLCQLSFAGVVKGYNDAHPDVQTFLTEMDDILEAVRVEHDPAEREQLAHDAMAIIYDLFEDDINDVEEMMEALREALDDMSDADFAPGDASAANHDDVPDTDPDDGIDLNDRDTDSSDTTAADDGDADADADTATATDTERDMDSDGDDDGGETDTGAGDDATDGPGGDSSSDGDDDGGETDTGAGDGDGDTDEDGTDGADSGDGADEGNTASDSDESDSDGTGPAHDDDSGDGDGGDTGAEAGGKAGEDRQAGAGGDSPKDGLDADDVSPSDNLGIDDPEHGGLADGNFQRVKRRTKEMETDIEQRKRERDSRIESRVHGSQPEYTDGSQTIRDDAEVQAFIDDIEEEARKLTSRGRQTAERSGQRIHTRNAVRRLSGDMSVKNLYTRTPPVESGDRAIGVAADMSNSLSDSESRDVKTAVAGLAHMAEAIGDGFVATGYTTDSTTQQDDGSHALSLQLLSAPDEEFEWDTLDAVTPEMATSTAPAMLDVDTLLDECPQPERLLFVITDGMANVMRDGSKPDDVGYMTYGSPDAVADTRDVVTELRAENTHVIGIGVGPVDREGMEEMFGEDGYVISDFETLSADLVQQYRQSLRTTNTGGRGGVSR